MKISARSILIAGVTTATVGAVAIAPSVQPAPSPRAQAVPAVALSAQTAKLPDREALTAWLAAAQRQSPDAAAAASLVADPLAAPTAGLLAFPGLGNAIKNGYDAIEFWVDYGVQWLAYAAGWIPFVGWIAAAQINIFYGALIEPIARTITYNAADWISGYISFLQAINNDILGSANAFIGFLNAQIDWGWSLLPPLPFPPPHIPYLPWFGLLQTQQAASLAAPEVGVQNAASDLVNAIYVPAVNTIDYGVDVLRAALDPIPLVNIVGDQVSILWNGFALPISNSVVFDLIDPVLNQPLNINSYLNGVSDVGATTLNSFIQTGINEVDYFLGIPLAAGAQAREVDRTAEVSTVPSLVKNSLAPSNSPKTEVSRVDASPSGPLSDITKTVRSVRNEIRSGFSGRPTGTKQVGDAADAGGNTVVSTSGATGGAVAKAISDTAKAARPGKPNKVAEDITNAPATVVKSIGDTARKVVKDVRQAAKDARNAAKGGSEGDSAE
jgi:hypothetical protein